MKLTKYLFILITVLGVLLAQETKISGLTFFEYRMDDTNSEFEINRAYFTFERNVSDNVDFKFQLDAGREKVASKIDTSDFSFSKKETRLYSYIKNAKLTWKTGFGKLIFGMQGMNMFSVQEKNWGYRFIEKSAIDANKFSSSADMGIGFSTKLGPVSTSVLYTNGAGYKYPESDEHKKVSVNAFLGEKKLGKGNGYNAGAVFSSEPTDTDPTMVYGAFAATQMGAIRVGGEYDVMSSGDETESLISVYGNFRALDGVEIFGRMDTMDETNSLLAGFNYKPESSLSIAPVIRMAKDGDETTTIYTVNFQFKI